MSWFEKAKTVLIEALDIQDDDNNKQTDNVGSGSASGSGGSNSAASTPSAKGATTTTNKATGAINSALTTSVIEEATFYDNPHANEMVTIPPRASQGDGSAAVSANLYAKRQSATSDSVDLLSSPSPTISPTSPSGGDCMQNSESSLELITAPTTASEMEMGMSPDTEPSLPDSIVIIASNETSDNADGDDDDDDDDVDADADDDDEPAIHLDQDDHSLHLNGKIIYSFLSLSLR